MMMDDDTPEQQQPSQGMSAIWDAQQRGDVLQSVLAVADPLEVLTWGERTFDCMVQGSSNIWYAVLNTADGGFPSQDVVVIAFANGLGHRCPALF
jgi:hypothetical protein